MKPRYVELRCRSYYSFLRGASSPADLIRRAVEQGLSGLALTDRDGVYGIPRAYLAAQSFPSFQFIVGAELTLEGYPRLSLLAMDRTGYGLLCRLITASHAGKPKGSAALSWKEFLAQADHPASQGLIVLPEDGFFPSSPLSGFQGKLDFFKTLRDLFPDRFYLPLIRVLDGRDVERTRLTLKLSQFLHVPIVAVNDVHFHIPQRRVLCDALTAVREGVALDEAGFKVFSNAERYLKSPETMARLFQDMPETVERSVEIAGRCHFSPRELRYRYPSEWIPPGETAESYLEGLVWAGARWRYDDRISEDVEAQLAHELKLIRELQFSDYFLTIWEVVEFAKSRQILCQGRGSAANSAVCFCLGITAVDPVRMGLLFERFISAERGEPPDIDVDFEHERREEVIQHIYEKYGRDRAGMVAAVITYRGRSSRRDLSKALKLDPTDERVRLLSREMRGFPRHLSIHSGGFTLSADPVIETVPIEPARMPGRTIIQWDKEDLAIVGLLKVDILALGMLTAIRKTFDLIRSRPGGLGRDLSMATIPAEEPEAYAMIQRADTIGVFQIESRAQMNMLGRLQPENFYDLVIQVAIVRPGPIQGQMVHPYLRRRRGLESSESPHPKLEEILRKTLGVPLFQEQVMKMAIHLAGFTPGEADELRRAIGAWRSSGSIEKLGKRLAEGLLKSGLTKDFIDRILKQIEGFAEYGFPESHAASFALIAYASAYLKCHYPAEFTCALINSQPMGFYSSHSLVDDVKRHGVEVLPVHPSHSDWDCTLENGSIRLGFRIVRCLGEGAARRMMEGRSRQPFRSLFDFISRSGLSFGALESLCMGDAFSCFGLDRKEALWSVLRYRLLMQSRSEAQMDFFESMEWEESSASVGFKPFSEYEMIQRDYRSYGLSTRGHPMGILRRLFKRPIFQIDSEKIKLFPSGRRVRLGGLVIVRQRPQTAKGTVFATLEDEKGLLDLVLHAKVLEQYEEIFLEHSFLIASGILQRDRHSVNLLVHSLDPMFPEPIKEGFQVASRDFR